MTDSGILLLKYWLEVSPDEQTRRLESRIDDPRKIWKLSPMDLKSYSRWYDYSQARDDMFAATDTAWAPWYIADADDKKRARLNIISHLLDQIPYMPLAHRDITLPKRQKDGGYVQPDFPLRHIPHTVLEDRQANPHMYPRWRTILNLTPEPGMAVIADEVWAEDALRAYAASLYPAALRMTGNPPRCRRPLAGDIREGACGFRAVPARHEPERMASLPFAQHGEDPSAVDHRKLG